MKLFSRQKFQVFNTQTITQSNQGVFFFISGNMSHQGQVLHQSTRFTLRSITRTKHSPLARLQCSRSTYFPGLHQLW
uniref:DNA-directed RNA polymerase subunit beta n=1 Tax=Rhizophora mucronata TaxID=61149 RepID=A0A2P2MN71_RHIMU